jgi:guanosine-3',5'-bis(diphosphate) 3'-pyrophosphohydrolase
MSSFFHPLRRRLKRYLPSDQIERIFQAYLFAVEAHGTQKRSSGEPYIIHPMAVANILADMQMDATSIIAAILHDILEDTSVTSDMLKKKFGEEALKLVDGVSKFERIKFESYAETHAKSFRKLMLAMANDIRVILIRLADRLHNMRTLQYLSSDRRRRIAKETLDIYAPIANRLGMNNLRIEFEELGFSKLYPLRYHILQEKIKKQRKGRKGLLRVVKSNFKTALKKSSFKSFTLDGREKHLYSVYQKMVRKHLRLSEIMDVYGFRLIVKTIDDCYRALGVFHNLYKPLLTKFKDYIAIPKANGYQALHTVLVGPYGLPIEVQIRTEAMNHMAENGIAAHWIYKVGDVPSESDEIHFRVKEWVKRILEIQNVTGNSLDFIEHMKADLFPDEIYVFTPKGDLIALPMGATVVDFAYSVHTDIGNRCVGAKINRRLAPLSTKLMNGEMVEILVGKRARPNPDWLDFVITAKARSQIREHLKTLKRTEAIALGRHLLENALKLRKMSLVKISNLQLDTFLKKSNLDTLEDLFEAIGLGNQLVPIVINQLMKPGEMVVVGNVKGGDKPLQIKGTEGVVVQFAKCCRPIPYDPIEGVLTAEHGIVIHHASCNNLKGIRGQVNKCLPVRWADRVEGQFQASIQVVLSNERGSLSKVVFVMTDMKADIDNVTMREVNEDFGKIDFVLTVDDHEHLMRIVRKIGHLREVVRVLRQCNSGN